MTTALTKSESQPKYRRGENPRSLANLKPPWKERPVTAPHSGPMITPAMKRFAAMGLAQLENIDLNKLTVAEAIAVTYLLDSLTTGSFSTGAKSREAVTQRLDGEPAKGLSVDVNVTTFTLSFNGSQEQSK